MGCTSPLVPVSEQRGCFDAWVADACSIIATQTAKRDVPVAGFVSGSALDKWSLCRSGIAVVWSSRRRA